MAWKTMGIVTASEVNKGAYGITTDTDENFYIPFRVAEAASLEEFDLVEVILVKNDRPGLPWMAIRVRRVKQDEEVLV